MSETIGSWVAEKVSPDKRAYLKQSRAIIPAASAEDATQLLQSTATDSIRIRYVSRSTFFRFFQTISDDPHQFLVVG
jgi:hypothetical protein